MKIKGLARENKRNSSKNQMPKHGFDLKNSDVFEINPLSIKRKKGNKNDWKTRRKENEHFGGMAG